MILKYQIWCGWGKYTIILYIQKPVWCPQLLLYKDHYSVMRNRDFKVWKIFMDSQRLIDILAYIVDRWFRLVLLELISDCKTSYSFMKNTKNTKNLKMQTRKHHLYEHLTIHALTTAKQSKTDCSLPMTLKLPELLMIS